MDPADLKTNFNCIGAPLELQDKIMRGRRETRLEYLWSEKTRHRLMIENETPPPVIAVRIVKGLETFIIDTFDNNNILLKVLDINIDRKYILILITDMADIVRGKPQLTRYLFRYNNGKCFLEIVPKTGNVSSIKEALAIVAERKMRIRMSTDGYF